MKPAVLAVILLILAPFLGVSPACAEKRVALVIGNAAYQHTQPLANPGNDAEDTASALRRVGFSVQFERDLDKRGMERALAAFARAARDADVALFYYAGHGLQHRGINYLMPIDARLEDEFSLDFEITRLDDVLGSLARSKGARILILDACRRNPLVERLAGMSGTRDFVAARGLARLDAPRGMVVAYSTQADQLAIDGAGRNSPFTAALVKQLGEPGLEIGPLFRRVAAEVNRTTGGRQLPELSISLLGEFYFNKADTDAQAWAKLRRSEDPGRLRDFVRRYPGSPLVADVQERIEAIERAEGARLERERLAREAAEREAREREAREREAREREQRLVAERRQSAQDGPSGAAPTAADQTATEPIGPALPPAPAEPVVQRPTALEQPAEAAPPAAGSAGTQTAMLPPPQALSPQVLPPQVLPPQVLSPDAPPPDAPAPLARTPLAGGLLVREIKKELQRIGCYAGRLDEIWSTAETAASVRKLVTYAKLSPGPAEPTIELLEAIRGRTGRVCPLECGPRQVERNGRCAPRTCPAGMALDEEGNCERRRTANVPPPTRGVEPSRAVEPTPTHRPGGAHAPVDHSLPGTVVRREPPGGSVPHGATVRVDDGSCPRGMIKEITGGNLNRNVPRLRRCVTR